MKIINGIVGSSVHDGSDIAIPFNSKQMQLALDRSDPSVLNLNWDMVCDICVSNGFIDPRGNMNICLLYTSPSPRDLSTSRMPSSA